ncbi:carbon-nitrogen family hydrolase [Bacillus suaedaesalsae]|uniref:Carbon-nitrogen family hydrolase n=1 Tax=Bacillus suaedaesalsae TaxID=2810349 RepID=A0ABS2DI28_9BACI|nr:carbon-nitrogen family hydrolase [Bacillus suaedaesalsae]
MKVSCIQFDIKFGSPKENYHIVKQKISEAMLDNPDIIVLPELWTTGYDLTRLTEIADSNGDETMKFLSEIAKEHNVYIVGGSIAKKTQSGVYNTMFAYSNKGELLGEYSKLHLFKLMDEHLYLESGETEGTFTIANIHCAGVICYDIRFPEWIRKHTTKGSEVLFVVAEWPLPRLSHWRSLLISRAIENQCYVVACNRSGQDPENVFAGHSMIIDPWGEVLVEAGEGESIIQAELDIEKVRTVRKHIPIFDDRRPDLY